MIAAVAAAVSERAVVVVVMVGSFVTTPRWVDSAVAAVDVGPRRRQPADNSTTRPTLRPLSASVT
jgi:hypothetical protein